MNYIKELENVGFTVETYRQFLQDCSDKISHKIDMDWAEIVAKYHIPASVDTIRKAQGSGIFGGSFVKEFLEHNIESQATTVETNISEQQELYMLRQKIRDERAALNRDLRNRARDEETEELLMNALLEKATEYGKIASQTPISCNSLTREIIILLSDWHIGASWDSCAGQYNVTLAEERLGRYLTEIKQIHSRYPEIQNCRLVLLGDNISGNIHASVQLTNRENVIEQIKTVCELLEKFIAQLLPQFTSIRFYSVGGNHSRLEKRKEDALLSERLDDIVPWYIHRVFYECKHFTVVENDLDDTAVRFESLGNVYYAVHGDFDGMNKDKVQNFCTFVGEIPDVILMGHMHSPSMTSVNGIKIVQCGCLGGTGDQYTRSKRLFGEPSQTVLICNENGIEAMYPINLSDE